MSVCAAAHRCFFYGPTRRKPRDASKCRDSESLSDVPDDAVNLFNRLQRQAVCRGERRERQSRCASQEFGTSHDERAAQNTRLIQLHKHAPVAVALAVTATGDTMWPCRRR